MGIQKFRSDKRGQTNPNGSIEYFAEWMGGSSLSKITHCPIGDTAYHQTVYIQGEPDTFFTIPAAIRVRGCTVKGFITRDESGPMFHPNKFGRR